MNRLSYFFIFCLAVCALSVYAATPEQMERGRAITIKHCLRDLNNGSDYLDKLNPGSVADLESHLKAKEKENIAKLKNIAIPEEKEYASWNKEQFDNYWSSTFVNKANLKSKNFTASKIKENIKNVTVTKQEMPKEVANVEEAATPEVIPEPVAEEEVNAEPAAEPEPIVEAAPIATEEVKEVPPVANKKKSDNTASIVVLCVLVVIVVLLVGYALNVMKKNRNRSMPNSRSRRIVEEEEEDDEEDYPKQTRQTPRHAHTSRPTQSYSRESTRNVSTVLNDPEEESPFAAYSNFQPESTPAPDSRDREIARLKAEIAALQSQVDSSAGRSDVPRSATRPSDRGLRQPRVIYLAQANADGVFTRADARYNMGNSIFKLVTTDGVSGSFSVIEDPTVFEIALMMPRDFLIHACSGHNLLYSEDASSIVNEASGTAIFEDGRWRVSRKAQIRYAH